MISARYMAEKPDDINFTMKITMSSKEWESLRDCLENARARGNITHEASRLSQMITTVLADARKTFWADDDDMKEF